LELHQELEKEQNLEYYYSQNDQEEEEEEEEDEKENIKEIKNDKDDKNNDETGIVNNNDKEKENNINNDNNKNEGDKNINYIEEEKDKNISQIKEENNHTNNIKEESTQEQTIESIQKTENFDKINQPIIEEIDTSITKNNNIERDVGKEGDIIIKSFNPNAICHRLIPKGSDLDMTNKGYFKCYKKKTKSNIISFITGSKKIISPYIIFIDENYYYMAKDKIVDRKNPNIRRIGNKYDLLKLSNFQATKKGDDYEFAFEFLNEDFFDRTFKLLYFTPKEAEDFYSVLHIVLGGFGIEIPPNLEGNEEEEEEEGEEGEEYEDGEEDEEEGEKENEKGGEDNKEIKNENYNEEDKKEERINNENEEKLDADDDNDINKNVNNNIEEEYKEAEVN